MKPVRVVAISLAILVTITAAQAQQNPALTGEPLIGALPEVNPFETEADIQQGAALFQTHCSSPKPMSPTHSVRFRWR